MTKKRANKKRVKYAVDSHSKQKQKILPLFFFSFLSIFVENVYQAPKLVWECKFERPILNKNSFWEKPNLNKGFCQVQKNINYLLQNTPRKYIFQFHFDLSHSTATVAAWTSNSVRVRLHTHTHTHKRKMAEAFICVQTRRQHLPASYLPPCVRHCGRWPKGDHWATIQDGTQSCPSLACFGPWSIWAFQG